MKQTKTESLIESMFNILVGYVVAVSSQIFIFPLVGIDVPITTNLLIGVYFTIISLVRSYCIRRWFNAGIHRTAHAITKRFFSRNN